MLGLQALCAGCKVGWAPPTGEAIEVAIANDPHGSYKVAERVVSTSRIPTVTPAVTLSIRTEQRVLHSMIQLAEVAQSRPCYCEVIDASPH
jgi:hypothetical protein